jgi:hypothetical protein
MSRHFSGRCGLLHISDFELKAQRPAASYVFVARSNSPNCIVTNFHVAGLAFASAISLAQLLVAMKLAVVIPDLPRLEAVEPRATQCLTKASPQPVRLFRGIHVLVIED